MSSYGYQTGTGRNPAAAPAKTAAKKAAPSDVQQLIEWANRVGVLSPAQQQAMARQAAGYAGSVINPQVTALRTQQADLLAQARAQAQQQGELGRSAADFLQGLGAGDAAAKDFADAAAAERGGAAYLARGLQQTVGEAADQVQRNLAAVGSPQTAYNQSQAAGQALFGLGGQLPATQLDLAGPTVAAGLRAQPGQLLGYGQQQASLALGAGQQAAAKLNPEITQVQAQRAKLTSDYLTDAIKAARESGQDRFANVLSVLKYQEDQSQAASLQAYRDRPDIKTTSGGGIIRVDPRTGQVTVLREPTVTPEFRSVGNGGLIAISPDGSVTTIRQSAPEIRSFGSGGVLKINEDGTTTVVRKPTVTPKSPTIRSIGDGGLVRVNPDGTTTMIRKPTPKAAKGTATSSTVFNRAAKVAQLAFSGPKGESDPVPWETAMKRVRAYLLGAGVPRKQVAEEARRALESVGYVKPLPKPKGSFLSNPQGWAAWLAAGGQQSAGGSGGDLNNLFG